MNTTNNQQARTDNSLAILEGPTVTQAGQKVKNFFLVQFDGFLGSHFDNFNGLLQDGIRFITEVQGFAGGFPAGFLTGFDKPHRGTEPMLMDDAE